MIGLYGDALLHLKSKRETGKGDEMKRRELFPCENGIIIWSGAFNSCLVRRWNPFLNWVHHISPWQSDGIELTLFKN